MSRIYFPPNDKFFTENKLKSFPYCKYMITTLQLRGIFEELKMHNNTPVSYEIIPPGVKTDGKFRDKYVVFEHSESESYYYTYLIDYFQEECRFLCKRNDQKENFLEYFTRNKKTIENYILAKYKKINYNNIWQSIFDLKHRICSEFDPMWMMEIVRYLIPQIAGKNILDMSAGRGARLVGAAAMGANYVGVDPADCVHKNYKDMIKFFGNDNIHLEVIKSGFEEDFVSPFESYDIMFCGPPYFNLEIYEDNPTQSINKFNTLQKWVDNFMIFSIKKALKMLKPGGYIVVNLDNPRNGTMDYVNPVLEFKEGYQGVITVARKNMKYSFWIWQKNL